MDTQETVQDIIEEMKRNGISASTPFFRRLTA